MTNDLKDIIHDYYNNNEKNLKHINNTIVRILLDNGLKVPEIDKLAIHLLRTPDSAKFKHYLLNKDENIKCRVCGAVDGLQLHHLKQVSSYPELQFDKNNVDFLCDSCHRLIHHGGGNGIDKKLKSKVKSIFKQELNRNRDKSNLLNKVEV